MILTVWLLPISIMHVVWEKFPFVEGLLTLYACETMGVPIPVQGIHSVLVFLQKIKARMKNEE